MSIAIVAANTFLNTVKVGTETVFHLEDFHIGDIYEIASIYYAGRNRHVNLKDAFECEEITETHIILKYLTQDEVIQRLGEENKDIVAKNLVQQLLRIVTKDPYKNSQTKASKAPIPLAAPMGCKSPYPSVVKVTTLKYKQLERPVIIFPDSASKIPSISEENPNFE